MICASYTRKAVKFGEAISIPEQNDRTEQFAKRYRLNITKKYSDRKDDRDAEDGFLEMKEAGMNRSFDCIVVWSAMYFGRDPLNGYNLLRHAFFPAGIDFAVVSDNFLSVGKTSEEIKQYLEDKYKERRRLHNAKQALVARDKRMNTLYGYKIEDGEFVIDEKVEDTVKQIFQFALDGKSKKDITEWLNESGIESPQIYLRREVGKDTQGIPPLWKYEYVKKILTDRRYMGERATSSKGVVSLVPMPAYIDEETYNRLNLEIPIRHVQKRENPLFKLVYDKDTMIRMYVGDYMSNGGWYYYVREKNDVTRGYGKKAIPADEVIGYIEEALRKEHRIAEKVYERLIGNECQSVYLKRTETLRLYIQELMEQLLSEVDGDNRDDVIAELDSRYSEAQTDLEKYQKTYCESNPWVKLYRGMPTFDALSFQTAKDYIDKVFIIRNEKVEFLPLYNEWKKRLPKEWLEV